MVEKLKGILHVPMRYQFVNNRVCNVNVLMNRAEFVFERES